MGNVIVGLLGLLVGLVFLAYRTVSVGCKRLAVRLRTSVRTSE